MCAREALNSLPAEAFTKMPSFLQSDDPLLNVGKKELLAALRMPSENRWVADWLFTDAATSVHRQNPLPPEAFENSLALHLRHDISTPTQCPSGPKSLTEPAKGPSSQRTFTISKDIDLLLVPVLDVDGITVGHSFMRGVHEAAYAPLGRGGKNNMPNLEKSFISGRFSFDNARRDFLMVVNGMSPLMTGIVSMRWRDQSTRDRSFFAIPKADYGPDYLPSRVLSMQNNVEYELPCRPKFQFEPPRSRTSPVSSQSPSPPSPSSRVSPDSSLSAADRMADADVDTSPFFPMDNSMDTDSLWSTGLESIGAVVGPDEDANRVISELLQDFTGQMPMDDVDNLMKNTTSLLTAAGSPLSLDKMEDSLPFPSSSQLDLAIPFSTALPWDSVVAGTTSDGVGIPRRPGQNDTSSGAFNMDTLTDSLATIERTLKGHFFGPKVRKDILHPMTGELVSRCTGEVIAKTCGIDPLTMNVLRETAAQAYYSSMLSLSTDARLIAAPPQPPPPFPQVQDYAPCSTSEIPVEDAAAIDAIRKRTLGISAIQPPQPAPTMKRPSPANLAPRPIPQVTIVPGASLAPSANSLTTSDVSSSDSKLNTQAEKEAAAEAKREAKRIKNRLSAAKSNQKRRTQLEAQKKELAVLRERVQELKSRKEHISEENEYLKKQIRSDA